MDRNELIYYLREPSTTGELFRMADEERRKSCGNAVHIRGIIEFSNYCCRNCLYCGLRRDNRNLKRYRMEEEEILACARHIIAEGVKTIVLQSGDDFYYTSAMLCRIVCRIKEQADIAITLSIGERPFKDYRALRNAGADRFLLKHETASEKLYGKLHPGQTLAHRLRILHQLRELGYQIGTGNIVGLPGQTPGDLCDDLLLMQELNPDMLSIGLFVPQHATPLGTSSPGATDCALKVLALARLATKNAHIPVTTAIVTADPAGGLVRGLKAGANVIMPDFTVDRYRKNYTIYDNKMQITMAKAIRAISETGRTIAPDLGNSLKKPNDS